MALNHLSDQIRIQLVSIFAPPDAGAPAQKQERSDRSEATDSSTRQMTPTQMQFDRPQAAWLQNALGDTSTTFGKHVDKRVDGIEKQIDGMKESSASVFTAVNSNQ